MIDMLKDPRQKKENINEWMGNFSKEQETIKMLSGNTIHFWKLYQLWILFWGILEDYTDNKNYQWIWGKITRIIQN